MPRKTREPMGSEKGFTLIELLVVILIIGILAAIALPVFLSQRVKGQDTVATSDARNLAAHMETCYATEQDYTGCEASSDVQDSGLDLGGGKGQVDVTKADRDSYTVAAQSMSGNTFTIEKARGAPAARMCDAQGDGGCPADGNW